MPKMSDFKNTVCNAKTPNSHIKKARPLRCKLDVRESPEYRDVDWANTRNIDIAAALGKKPRAVSAYRHNHGKPEYVKPVAPKYRQRAMKITGRWAGVDWSRPIESIAEEMGCAINTAQKQKRRWEENNDRRSTLLSNA